MGANNQFGGVKNGFHTGIDFVVMSNPRARAVSQIIIHPGNKSRLRTQVLSIKVHLSQY